MKTISPRKCCLFYHVCFNNYNRNEIISSQNEIQSSIANIMFITPLQFSSVSTSGRNEFPFILRGRPYIRTTLMFTMYTIERLTRQING